MLKPLHEITLKDIVLLDTTKNASILKKYWFIPLWLCKKELETLGKQIFDSIYPYPANDLKYQIDKIISHRELLILEALHKAMTIEIQVRPRINAWEILLNGEGKESNYIQLVISEIQKYSGIKIESMEDFESFSDFTQRKISNHLDTYPDLKLETKNEVSISEVILSVFNYMVKPYDGDMKFLAFIELKKIAEEKQSKTEDNGIE